MIQFENNFFKKEHQDKKNNVHFWNSNAELEPSTHLFKVCKSDSFDA